MELKRFITYLYDYKNGEKGKNAGFVRVDLRGKEVRLQVHICNVSYLAGKGTVYLLIQQEEMFGLGLGSVESLQGDVNEQYTFCGTNILNSNFDFTQAIGLAVCLENGYLASNWKDDNNKALCYGDFKIWSPDALQTEESILFKQEVEGQSENTNKEESKRQCDVLYEKIQLTALRDLPPKNRHFCNNSFLIHGFFNYHYLVLKKESVDDTEVLSLGIPGVFEQPEKMIAAMFEFTEFEALLEEGEVIRKKENQEQKEGTFGAWFTKLKQ